MIKERYCSYEVARLLKEKGFSELCRYCYGTAVRHNGEDIDEDEEFELKSEGRADEIKYIKGGILHNLYYDNGGLFGKDVCAAPTHQMACDWLGEVHGIYITIVYGDYPSLNKVFWTPQINSLKEFDLPDDFYEDYDEYGEACEAALKYALENLI
jgi:hypothetical protein